jgi:hypothetical protein
MPLIDSQDPKQSTSKLASLLSRSSRRLRFLDAASCHILSTEDVTESKVRFFAIPSSHLWKPNAAERRIEAPIART